MNMFENDRSAARGLMTSRELIVFKHESKFGNAPAHRLFDLVHVDKVDSKNQVAREFGDYTITIDEGKLPQGVEIRTYDYIARRSFDPLYRGHTGLSAPRLFRFFAA